MNPDLKLRLRPFTKLSEVEYRFWLYLSNILGQEAMLNCSKDSIIYIRPGPVENDEDDSAYVEGDGSIFNVYIDNRMPLGMCIDFLIHELSHVRSWHHDEEDDHGPEFGKSYAALYRLYLDCYERFWCG